MSGFRVARWWWLFALALLFVLVLPWDATIAQWCRDQKMPGELRTILRLSEVFAHGYGVAAILISLLLICPQDRRGLCWAGISAYGAGLIANLIKINIVRFRPQELDSLEYKAWLVGFDGWLPWLHGADDWLNRGVQAFPSGHMTTATGLAVGLATLYPRGRFWFALLAILAGLQRIDVGAHFPTDVIAGALIGCAWGSLVMRFAKPSRSGRRTATPTQRSTAA